MKPFAYRSHLGVRQVPRSLASRSTQNGDGSIPEIKSGAKWTERNLADAKQISLDQKNLSIKDAAKAASERSEGRQDQRPAPQARVSPTKPAGGTKVLWDTDMVPHYMQHDSSSAMELRSQGGDSDSINPIDKATQDIWRQIKEEAAHDAAEEPLLSSYLYASIMAQQSLEQALAFVLANRMASQTLLPTQLFELFYDVIRTHDDVRKGAVKDLQAVRDRDPACASFAQALLYYKGYHALQVYRLSHALWNDGRQVMALALQSQGVTLGGTGKEQGDRHPKIEDDVLIGAQATILGNIRVGKGVQVASGSLVLKEVPPHSLVAGAPAQVIQYLCESECPGINMGANFETTLVGEGPVTSRNMDDVPYEGPVPDALPVRYTFSDKQAAEMFKDSLDATAYNI